MRKSLAIILSLLLLVMVAAPAAAAPVFSIQANGQAYEGDFKIIEGTTMVPLDWLGSIIDAQISMENEQIKIQKDQNALTLDLGSKKADFNQRKSNMPQAPVLNNDMYLVPLRYVAERFGAGVEWDPITHEIIIEAGAQDAANQILEQIRAAVTNSNSFKMKAATLINMDMMDDGQNQQVTISGIVNASISQEPLLFVMDSEMKFDAVTGIDEEMPTDAMKSQAVLNEDGYYITMPGEEGWLKMEMEGFDLDKIMEQYGSQNPIGTLTEMKEFGAVITQKDDQIIDGQSYGMIHIVMGKEAFTGLFDDMLAQIGTLIPTDGTQNNEEFDQVMRDIMENMKIDMVYNIIYDKNTFLPYKMSLNNVTTMNVNVPADEDKGTPAQTVQINMNQKADYLLIDYGIAFPVPVIEDYKTMDEWVAEQNAAISEGFQQDIMEEVVS